MNQQGGLLLMIAVAAILLGLMVWGWLRRVRRDRGEAAPFGDIPVGARVVAELPSLYVATTRHDQPLERLAIRGLAYRSKADVTVTDAGVALDIPGQERIFLDAARIDSATQATVTIDRVVERDGLTRIAWRLSDGTAVDSYVRPQDASAHALASAVAGILPARPATEGDS